MSMTAIIESLNASADSKEAGSNTVKFNYLRVKKMPGIEVPFLLDDLSHGVNIIHGPNGCGKSTTRRALEAILWPMYVENNLVKQGLNVKGGYKLSGGDYSVALEGKEIAVQRNGADCDPVIFSSPEFRQRYHLSLRDLIHDDGSAFAAEIYRQSVGGVDIDKAHKSLNYKPKPGRAGPLSKELREAKRKLAVLIEKQNEIIHAEDALADLIERQKKALMLGAETRLLEAAEKLSQVKSELAHASKMLEQFPASMSLVTGTEVEEVGKIRKKVADVTNLRDSATTDKKSAQVKKDQAISSSELPDRVRKSLRVAVDRLDALENTIQLKGRELAAADELCERALTDITPDMKPELLERIDSEAIRKLENLAREAGNLEQDLSRLEAHIKSIETGIASPDSMPAEQGVSEGIALLSRWLQNTHNSAQSSPSWAREPGKWIFVAGLIALVIAVALPHNFLALFAFIVAILFSYVGYKLGSRRDQASDSDAEAQFKSLNVPQPDVWTPDSVQSVLRELMDLQNVISNAAYAIRQIKEISGEKDRVSEELGNCRLKANTLAGQYGIPGSSNIQHLQWLLEKLRVWQSSSDKSAGIRAELTKARAQQEEQLREVATILLPYKDWTPPDTLNSAKGFMADVEERHARFREASVELSHAEQNFERAQKDLQGLEEELDAIYKKCNVDSGDDVSLRKLIDQFASYKKAQKTYESAKEVYRREQAYLQSLPDYRIDLEEISREEIESRLLHAREETESIVSLTEEISTTREKIKNAKQSHAIEEALEEIARCEGALMDERDKDLRAMIGDSLVEFVRQEAKDNHLPGVFKRAREIFLQITDGRHELVLDQSTFRAFDRSLRKGQAIEELSSGTQIQLQLAVRLAFVETQEREKLPLFLDETLGTSDDIRGAAVIDTVISLAQQERQVFYFTARPDEVKRWRTLFDQQEIPYKEIDLGMVRQSF